MADHNEFGNLAEEEAVNYLKQKGYKIITQNFRFQKAEIDIIAKHQNQIVIIEVKARKNDVFLEPFEAVNKRKIRLIISATDEFLRQNNETLETRFDIISILSNEQGQLEITHIENAFEAFDAN